MKSFNRDKGTIHYDNSTSDTFEICTGVIWCCVVASTLFGISFAVLVLHAIGDATEGVYLHTR